MNRRTRRLVGIVVAFALVAVSATGPVVASHGTPGEWVIEPANPPEDAQPGYESASYIHWAQGGDDFRGDGLREVHNIEMTSEEIGFADCTLFDVKAFGIDRGGDNEGTETDENLATHVKDYDFAADRMWMSMYESGDAGGDPIHLNASDQFVAHQTNCYTNPSSAGWYQLEGWANGTAWDGEFDEARLFSHYFYVCDCENESQAREKLGPPPSEQSASTPTPTATPSPNDGDDGSDDGDDQQDDGAETTPEPTPTSSQDADGDETGESTPVDDDGDQQSADGDGGDENDEGSGPSTPGDGPGFGALAAVLALLGAALLVRRP